MGKKTVSTPQVLVNDVVFAIVPNTLSFTEGLGEYNQRGSSVGSGKTEVVFSENAESKMSSVKFEMYPTAENIEAIRSWKTNFNDNLIQFVDIDLTRSFTNVALVNDYELNLGADTTISLEFVGDPAV